MADKTSYVMTYYGLTRAQATAFIKYMQAPTNQWPTGLLNYVNGSQAGNIYDKLAAYVKIYH